MPSKERYRKKATRLQTPESNSLISRRKFMGLAATASAAGATYLVADRFGLINSEPENTPTPLETNITDIDLWRKLNSKDRLNRLWNRNIPNIENFDSIHEVVVATAEFFCSQISTNITPSELIDKTHIMHNHDEYLHVAYLYSNITRDGEQLSEEESKSLLSEFSKAITTNPDRNVYLSLPSATKTVEEGILQFPQHKKILQENDGILKGVSYLLLHEYGHVIESGKKEDLTKPIILMTDNGYISLKRFEGLNLVAEVKTENNIFETLLKSNEPLIDSIAIDLASKSGNDFPVKHSYTEARLWAEQLNSLVGLGFYDLVKYVKGDLPISDLLIKWGSISARTRINNESRENRLKAGTEILTIFALNVGGQLTNDDAFLHVERILLR